MEKLNWSAILVACIVVAGVFAVSSSIVTPLAKAKIATITSLGNAKQYFDPDQGSIYIKIERRNDSSGIAKDMIAEIINKVLNVLEELEIDENDIETTDYRVYQNYYWENGTRIWTDFTATCTIHVTVKDFDKIGDVIDGSVDAGALISSIDFQISNENMDTYKTIVMGKAAENAKSRAQNVALCLGKTLGDVTSVSFDHQYNSYRYWTYGSGLSDVCFSVAGNYTFSPPTEIQPKDLSISASITVVFEII